MSDPKPSYTDLVYQTVRESDEPLSFAEIMERVNSLLPITTRNPKGTIRNAISQARLIMRTSDGRYGWKYRLINGSSIRLPISESYLIQHQIIYSEELKDALWPSFFENKKHRDQSPALLSFANEKSTRLHLTWLRMAVWGTPAQDSPELWGWLDSVKAKPGDDLIFHVVDSEARLYEVEFQAKKEKNEVTTLERNQQIILAASVYNRQNRSIVGLWDISSHLLATGMYKHPVPPDPLAQILVDVLWEPDVPSISSTQGWAPDEITDVDPLISSLLEQIGEILHHRRLRKEPLVTTTSTQIYQLKIILEGTHPPIWRRIQVPGNISLPCLHAVVQIVMGWTNSHLHGFKVGDDFYSEPYPDDDGLLDTIDERPVNLIQIAPNVGSHFVYEYDFGDSWDHELIVEQVITPQKDMFYPCCIEGERACPPEDVGGRSGYAEFLEAIRNRKHPEHFERLQWIGGKFDPEIFDLQQANDLLRVFQAQVEKR